MTKGVGSKQSPDDSLPAITILSTILMSSSADISCKAVCTVSMSHHAWEQFIVGVTVNFVIVNSPKMSLPSTMEWMSASNVNAPSNKNISGNQLLVCIYTLLTNIQCSLISIIVGWCSIRSMLNCRHYSCNYLYNTPKDQIDSKEKNRRRLLKIISCIEIIILL